MGKVVAIHQPNFFPWLGFFDKIVKSDYFVFLDHVQFPKTGGVWTNRVMFLVSGEARWVTAPIVRNYHGVRAINEMEFQSSQPWREKMIKTISINYRKAPYFEETMAFFEPLILNQENNISGYNIHAILAIAKKLGIGEDKFFRSSKLNYHGASNEMLVSLSNAVGADTYMCGGGAEGYQDEGVFKEAGVELLRQNFLHPFYQQVGASSFVKGLSIIDVFMNIGWTGAQDLLGQSK